MRITHSIPVLLFLAALHAGAQGDAPDLTLRSNARLVQVSVIAQDRQGHPVLDLKREDFRLFDDKIPREIRVFSVDRVRPAGGAPTGAGRRFSNTSDDRATGTGITVIVLDTMNTRWTDQSQAVRQVVKFLRQIQPGDRVAIYSIGAGGLRVLHDFTRDASDLVERLAKWKGEMPQAPRGRRNEEGGGGLAEVLAGRDRSHLGSQFAGDLDIHYAEGSLRALEAIAHRLEGIPGRKNLIWISDGFPEVEWGSMAVSGPHDPRGPEMVPTGMPRGSGGEPHDTIGDDLSHRTAFVGAMKTFVQSNVAIYPVEARGLLTEMPTDGTGASTRAHLLYQQGTQAPMLEMAKKTGGRAFVNNNDVAGAIRESIDDSRVTYTLGFYPDASRTDGRFHEIAIKVPERRDVTLRYRTGYVNEAFSATDMSRRKRELDDAFWSPIDENAIPLTATATTTSKPGETRLQLSISVRSLDLTPAGDRLTGELDVLILQRNETGDVFGRVNETIQMALKNQTYEAFLSTGAMYQHIIEVDPRATTIRVVVRDALTGNLGSLSIPAPAVSSQ